MAISILNHIAPLAAQDQSSITQADLTNILEQLSSGSRINSGSNDAAGLTIAHGTLSVDSGALASAVSSTFSGVQSFLQSASIGCAGNINTVLTVIGHLRCALDRERGGEPAKHFALLYSLTRGMVVQAIFRATPEPTEELVDLHSGVRQAWYQAGLQTHADRTKDPATEPPGIAATPAPAGPVRDEFDTRQLRWSA
jgi:flagellin-specific chaperone FliS